MRPSLAWRAGFRPPSPSWHKWPGPFVIARAGLSLTWINLRSAVQYARTSPDECNFGREKARIRADDLVGKPRYGWPTRISQTPGPHLVPAGRDFRFRRT